MDFIGLECGICGKEFEKGDDAVVCPECGTPMHRSCYNETRICPNFELHKEGFVFDGFDQIKKEAQRKADKYADDEEDDEEEEEEEGDRTGLPRRPQPAEGAVLEKKADGVCPICGNRSRRGANFCDNCGTRLSNVTAASNLDPSEVDYSDPKFFASYALGQGSDVGAGTVYEENVTAGDVACYVAVNTPYYLLAFKRIKDGRGKFNFSAAVFSGVWFLYRKLYRFGALFLSLEALLYALNVYFTQNLSMNVMEKLLSSIGLTMSSVSTLTMEQYLQLSQQLQKLPIGEQLIMMAPTFLLLLQIAVMVVSGAVANKLYYRKCIKSIKEVKENASEKMMTRSETSQSLYLSGGVNAILAGVFGLIYLFLLFT